MGGVRVAGGLRIVGGVGMVSGVSIVGGVGFGDGSDVQFCDGRRIRRGWVRGNNGSRLVDWSFG